ncbi:hypothetical protein [Domibacillus sp.]|uniref:hypothetical protein n=1 Tax=Domibacillus sp. TaxID=1969783 RepID=UPI002811AD75|nr:hypothetical protein [Domibacillus sp.]
MTVYFKGQNKFPKFKKKHAFNQSYSTKETDNNIKFNIESETVQLSKIGKVKVRLSKKHCQVFRKNGFNGKIKEATVSRHSSGCYYISLKVEEVIPLKPKLDLASIWKC